jgi:hypothetical protein
MTRMGKLVGFALVAGMVLKGTQAHAVEGKEVAYVSGTSQTIKEGVVGVLNTSSATDLVFEAGSGRISIPYTRVVSYQYRQEVKVHLGVLPAIAVGLVKKRARRHLVTIIWQGEGNQREVMTLEVAKTEPQALLALLRARATEACKPKSGQVCGQ